MSRTPRNQYATPDVPPGEVTLATLKTQLDIMHMMFQDLLLEQVRISNQLERVQRDQMTAKQMASFMCT